MFDKFNKFYEYTHLEELSQRENFINKLDAVVKVITTVIFIVITVSFNNYEISGLIPLFFYPIIVATLADISLVILIKKSLIPLILIIGIGIFNPLFDKTPMLILPWFSISSGWVSFISITIKGLLTIMASQILISTTGIYKISLALSKLKVPKIFIMQLMLTFRYISLFVEEISRTVRAYSIRAHKANGITYKEWGSLVGGLLLRTIDRAEKVYNSMRCRGFTGEYDVSGLSKINIKDILYCLIWFVYFSFIRYYNVSYLIGALMSEVNKWIM